MRGALAVVERRLSDIDADPDDLNVEDIHHWQDRNPLTTEHLLQCRLGGPSPVYYGGHVQASLRICDESPSRTQSLLSALVTGIDKDSITLHVVNTGLSPVSATIWGGAQGEHVVTGFSLREESPSGDAPVTVELLDGALQASLPGHANAEVVLRIERRGRPPRPIGMPDA